MTEENTVSENLEVQGSEDSQEMPHTLMAERFRGFYPVVVDVETAGFNATTDALIEVGANTVKFNEDGLLVKDESFHANIVPFKGANLEQSNLAFLGVDPFAKERFAMSEENFLKPFFKKISKKARAAGCSRAILVGQNGSFDHSFILAAAERIKFKRCPFHPFSVIDLASLSMVMLGQSVLSVAVGTAGIEFDSTKAHGAMYDTDIETELFCWLINRYKSIGGWPLSEELQNAAREANERKKEMFSKNKTGGEIPSVEEQLKATEDPNNHYSPFSVLKDLDATKNSEENSEK